MDQDVVVMLDLNPDYGVQIQIDRKRGIVHVNVDGLCRLRASGLRRIKLGTSDTFITRVDVEEIPDDKP